MFAALRKAFHGKVPEDAKIALQPPGVTFPWPYGVRLTALEPVTIAIPAAAIGSGENIGSVVFADADLEICLPQKPTDSVILLRLKSGASVSLSKSVQGVVIADDKDDKRPKKIRVVPARTENP